MTYIETLKKTKLIAILRGVKPNEVEVVAQVLVNSGFRIIEVPLNSPDAFSSIDLLVKKFKDNKNIFIGAGTVCFENEVKKLKELGASLVISPNVDKEVIIKTKKLHMTSSPGFLTPSEAYIAIKAGADCLKLFPFKKFGIEYYKDIKVIIPSNIPIVAVGGVDEKNIKEFKKEGIEYFGLGSSLYKPNIDLTLLKTKADFFVNAVGSKNE